MIYKFYLELKNNYAPANQYAVPAMEIRSASLHSACQEVEKRIGAKLTHYEPLEEGNRYRVYFTRKKLFKKTDEFVYYVECE
jgi:hypothetical protein